MQSLSIRVNDIWAIGDLVEHYQFHKNKYGDDFLCFLSKHYGSSQKTHRQHDSEDHQDHDKLPFHHAIYPVSTVVYFVDYKPFVVQCEGVKNDRQETIFREALICQSYISGVFQPPKQA